MQPCAVLTRRLVDFIQKVKENALAVGVALLRFEVGIQCRIIKNRAIVDKRPAPSGTVSARERVTVFVFYVADGSVADMREQKLFGDRL